ncbi:N-acetylmuramoyl-L-alanine amidase [Streptomyces sp. Z26]|uniref:N-acetylmuramoyl-L-alanine amidase n=1 Tax=Streptomyces sp. Z26 TaxID=2500177 RepID=UPI000EF15924|nr:N-acetylmuramoyl-L-alanine amidase [Streptomyces sp. Z26]RLL68124.1 N-acetylmuramoyl-L-alanine amidase [Streptomyces sp. Z26]
MATPLTFTNFVDAMRDEGVTVKVVGDAARHNRNKQGAWGPVHGVVIHHTVTKGSQRTVDICRDGYSSLPGPLCHGVITKDGTVHVVGYGRANHAGLGDDDVLRAVIAERDLPRDDEANTDGNSRLYGFECENLGDGEDPWPAAQLEAIEKAAAALCRAHGWSAASVLGHLEWQPGKVDPRGFGMDGMRDRIAERLGGKPTPRPQLPAPKRPKVSLKKLVAAARSNPKAKGQPVTYSGVRTYEAALVDEGLLAKQLLDGHFGTATLTATSEWQERLGYRGRKPGEGADGIPGRDSATKLGRKHGFDLVD